MTLEIWPSAADLGLPQNMVRITVAADRGPERAVSSIMWDIIHDTEGYFANDEPYLAAATPPVASCHALISPDGLIVLMVPLNFTAWTPGNDVYARKSINLEISGFASKGFTDAQYTSYAAYHRWAVRAGAQIEDVYIGRSGAASGILGHQDVPNPNWPNAANQYGGVSGHTDPGPKFNWNRFVSLCQGGSPVVPYNPNPQNFSIGAGALVAITREQMTATSAEQYFTPNSGQTLGQRSFTYASKMGVTYQVEAIQDLGPDNKPLETWTTEIWQFLKVSK